MRDNQPITAEETTVNEGQILVSRTDPDSRITFANKAFIEVSGFSEAELKGQPHNLVRHPDMPAQAFSNMWATIKAGRPWEGLVKNRTKKGGFYWVRANVTPVMEGGKSVGYISIRSRPVAGEAAAAEAAYAAMRAGGAAVHLVDGELRRTGIVARLRSAVRSITFRLAICFVVMIAMMLGLGAITLRGLDNSNAALSGLYADRMVPAGQLAVINDLMQANFALLRDATFDVEAGAAEAIKQRARQIAANGDQITRIWGEYMATYLTEEEKQLAASFAAMRARFVKEGLEVGIAIAERGDLASLRRHLRTTMPPLIAETRIVTLKLIELQQRVAKQIGEEAAADFRLYTIEVGAVLAAACLFSIVFSLWLLATIRRPLHAMEGHFDTIARGDLGGQIPLPPAGEFHQLARQLRAMRARLSYVIEERAERERQSATERRAAVQEMASNVENETRLAVEGVSRETTRMAGEAQEMSAAAQRVSDNATSVAAAAEQALANAQAVSAASEELTASINEIAGQVAQAGAVAQHAVAGGARARQRIRSLSESAARIGDVVQLISSIAAQTNLLALNATIEAARAGDAGKGFAVVASEVKNLATQTARSTEEIARQIAEIQATTGAVVEAVGEIGNRITELAQVSITVAAAVEQQASATQEITRNVVQTGIAAQEVSQRIAEVSAEAAHTGAQADNVRAGTDAIAGTIAALSGSIVRAIRATTEDADRRQHPRHLIDRPCSVALVGGGRLAAVLSNISRGGARIDGMPQAPVGAHGTLTADSLGADCRAGFSVVEAAKDGTVRVLFTQGTISPGLTAALDKLENHGRAAA